MSRAGVLPLALVSLAFALSVPAPAFAAEQTATFDYTGWFCARCGPKIEKALRKRKSVQSAVVTLDRVTVVYDDRLTNPEELAAIIEAAGPYKVSATRIVVPTPTPSPSATPAPSSTPPA